MLASLEQRQCDGEKGTVACFSSLHNPNIAGACKGRNPLSSIIYLTADTFASSPLLCQTHLCILAKSTELACCLARKLKCNSSAPMMLQFIGWPLPQICLTSARDKDFCYSNRCARSSCNSATGMLSSLVSHLSWACPVRPPPPHC